MVRYLLDTNVVSDYFSSAFENKAIIFLEGVIDDIPNLSIITEIELLCWKASSKVEKKVRNFIGDSQIFEINPEVVKLCAEIRRAKKIKTPDAIIAATAIVYNLILITNNEKDFSGIKKLKLLNPHKII
jgi:predicted nucleic acid-binding protein